MPYPNCQWLAGGPGNFWERSRALRGCDPQSVSWWFFVHLNLNVTIPKKSGPVVFSKLGFTNLDNILMEPRQVEFGKAIAKNNLNQDGKLIYYFGFVVQETYKDTVATIRDLVYKNWDALSTSPPKARPTSEANPTPPELQLLAWQSQEGRPKFPESLLTRYDEGTPEHAVIMEKKAEFDVLYPPVETFGNTTGASRVGRAGGSCDYGFDSSQPIDVLRVVLLEMTDTLDPTRRPCVAIFVFKADTFPVDPFSELIHSMFNFPS